MAYSDSTQVSNFLQRSLTSYETAELTNILAAIKIWIDKRLNSTFDQATSSTRYYDGGVRNLSIDPCTAITKVEAISDDGSSSYTYTDTYEYVAEPQNETVKRELRKRLAAFPRGVHRIAVTALFSEYDSAVPADIQIAATRLAASVINQGKYAGSGGNVLEEALEGHQIRYQIGSQNFDGLAASDPTVASILENRKELYVDDYERRNEFGYEDGDDGGLLI
jgi:hypothetical protein